MNELPKISRKITIVTFPKLVKMTIILLTLTKTQRLYFMTEKTIVKASKIDSSLKKRIYNIVHLPPFKQVFKRSF